MDDGFGFLLVFFGSAIFGFWLGAKMVPVDNKQWEACVKICEPNQGVSSVRSTGHCWCGNGVEGSPP